MENATSLKTDLIAHYEVSQARISESPVPLISGGAVAEKPVEPEEGVLV